jgi:hypothetical protein
MTSMVDDVATALRRKYITSQGLTWEEIARSVIAVMREPTRDMISAIPGTADPQIAEIAAEHWRLMISAALLAPGPRGKSPK